MLEGGAWVETIAGVVTGLSAKEDDKFIAPIMSVQTFPISLLPAQLEFMKSWDANRHGLL